MTVKGENFFCGFVTVSTFYLFVRVRNVKCFQFECFITLIFGYLIFIFGKRLEDGNIENLY